MGSSAKGCMAKMKPYVLAILLQVAFAGMDVLTKAALNKGMSTYVLVVYRHAIAAVVLAPLAAVLDKGVRPKMTVSIFIKIMVLSLLEPVIDQNLYYVGMKYTTATFAAAMFNIVPAVTFVMAWIMRLEIVNFRSIRSHAKLAGTLTTVGGAMVMTLLKGPVIGLIWTRGRSYSAQEQATNGTDVHSSIKGGLMIAAGCFSYASFMILQAVTIKSYPAELSLTVWICVLGAIEGTAVTLIMERGDTAIWALKSDIKLVAAIYSAMACGFAYYVQGVIMKDRGPVFVTSFSPLIMVIVAVMSSIVLAEQMLLGRVIGAIIIIMGLYLVLWGKNADSDSQTEPTGKEIDAIRNEECCEQEVITIAALGGNGASIIKDKKLDDFI